MPKRAAARLVPRLPARSAEAPARHAHARRLANGKSVLPDVLDGKAATQIEAIWVYLQDGGKAQLPGWHGQDSRSRWCPTTNAIIYRNFIAGRGVAGHRRRLSGEGQPGLRRQRDAAGADLAGRLHRRRRHWTDRGEGFEGPLGDNILHLPAGASVRRAGQGRCRLADDAAEGAWATASCGYRADAGRSADVPYALRRRQGRGLSQRPAAGKEPSLQRTLKLMPRAAADNLYFRAAVGRRSSAWRTAGIASMAGR